MKCNNCKSEWASNYEVSICPFCGKPLNTVQEAMDISLALTKIVDDFGEDVLNNPSRVIACVMDYVLENQKEKKLLRIAGDNKIFELMITARKSQNTEQQKAICEKAVTVLEDEAFLSKENARYIVSIIARGLSVVYTSTSDKKMEEPKEKSEIKDSLHVLQKEQMSFVKDENKILDNTVTIEPKKELVKKTREYYIDLAIRNTKAANRNDIDEIYKIGREEFQCENYETAVSCFRLASKFGNRDAFMIMGYCYEFGYGVPEDEQAANGFYHLGEISNLVFDNYCLKHSSESRATNRSGYAYGLLNNPKALSINNKKYSNTTISETKILPQKTGAEEKKRKGLSNFWSNILGKEHRIETLQQIVDSNDKATVEEKAFIMNYGREYLLKGEYQKGLKWIKYAASHGYSDANFILGYCYDNGIGVAKDSKIAEAFYLQGSNSCDRYRSYSNRYGDGWLRQAREEGYKLYMGKQL